MQRVSATDTFEITWPQAVMTETGGVTSHPAICAREFSIPCVAATQVGASAIPDGATVTVDAEAGTVAILEG